MSMVVQDRRCRSFGVEGTCKVRGNVLAPVEVHDQPLQQIVFPPLLTDLDGRNRPVPLGEVSEQRVKFRPPVFLFRRHPAVTFLLKGFGVQYSAGAGSGTWTQAVRAERFLPPLFARWARVPELTGFPAFRYNRCLSGR